MDEKRGSCHLIVKVIRADIPSANSGPNIPCSYLVELSFNGKKDNTTVKEDAGCSPVWNEYFEFQFETRDAPAPGGGHTLEARVCTVGQTGRDSRLLLLGTVQLGRAHFSPSLKRSTDMPYPWKEGPAGTKGTLVLKVFLSDVDEVQRETWASNPLTNLWQYLEISAEEASTGTTLLPADSVPKEISPCFESGEVVERMQYLFVRVVKARGLPDLDANGSLDPYVEVKLGDYRGVTKEVKRSKNPEWNAVFAFPFPMASGGGGGGGSVDVTVYDKDLVKDEFVGMVFFELRSIPERSPSDAQLEAPVWHQLLDHGRGRSAQAGSLMLAVWIGSQADQAYSDAWILDTVVAGMSMSHSHLSAISPKVYYSPRVWYLQLTIFEFEAQLSTTVDDDNVNVFVEARVGRQEPKTTDVTNKSMVTSTYVWNKEFVLAAAEGDHLEISVCTNKGDSKVIGQTAIQLAYLGVEKQSAGGEWFDLRKPGLPPSAGAAIAMRVRLHSRLEAADRRDGVGARAIARLELGILGAGGLTSIKDGGGRLTTSPYCVAKCGAKWVRTRTVVATCDPVFNEQHHWDVHDTAAVLTVGVFNNSCLLQQGQLTASTLDTKIGMVRIRLSDLQTGRLYTRSYPLFALSPKGPDKTGELRLAVRLSPPSSWIRMVRLHVRAPPAERSDELRAEALAAVRHRLSRMEPPLRPEVVEHMCRAPTPPAWSLRRSKAQFNRLTETFSGLASAARWFRDVRAWKSPAATLLAHAGFLLALWFHRLVLPLLLLSIAVLGARNYRRRPTHPQHVDLSFSHAHAAQVHPDELDEEFDRFKARQLDEDVVRMRYDRLRLVAGRLVTVVGDFAVLGERLQSLVSWRDPRATAIFQALALMAAITLWLLPLKLLLAVAGLYLMRHPRHAEMQKLAVENERLDASHVSLRKELAAAQQELQMLQSQGEAARAAQEQDLRGLLEKAAKMEADLKSREAVKAELQQAHTEAQSLVAVRQQLAADAQKLGKDLQRNIGEAQQLPALSHERDAARQEYQHIRATYEYERKLRVDHSESLQVMKRNYDSMVTELEKLRAELTNTANPDKSGTLYNANITQKDDGTSSRHSVGQIAYDGGYGGAQARTPPTGLADALSGSPAGTAPRSGFDPSRGNIYDTSRLASFSSSKAGGHDTSRGATAYDSSKGAGYDASKAAALGAQAAASHGSSAGYYGPSQATPPSYAWAPAASTYGSVQVPPSYASGPVSSLSYGATAARPYGSSQALPSYGQTQAPSSYGHTQLPLSYGLAQAPSPFVPEQGASPYGLVAQPPAYGSGQAASNSGGAYQTPHGLK